MEKTTRQNKLTRENATLEKKPVTSLMYVNRRNTRKK